MGFKKIFIKVFRKNLSCEKCNCVSNGNLLCEKCQEYIDDMEIKKEGEVQAKEDLRRRNWIEVRDKFLENKNG